MVAACHFGAAVGWVCLSPLGWREASGAGPPELLPECLSPSSTSPSTAPSQPAGRTRTPDTEGRCTCKIYGGKYWFCTVCVCEREKDTERICKMRILESYNAPVRLKWSKKFVFLRLLHKWDKINIMLPKFKGFILCMWAIFLTALHC